VLADQHEVKDLQQKERSLMEAVAERDFNRVFEQKRAPSRDSRDAFSKRPAAGGVVGAFNAD
jgi:hypothetical protein